MGAGIKRWLIIILILAAAIVAVGISLSAVNKQRHRLVVSYLTVRRQPLQEQVSGSGVFRARKRLTLKARVSGIVRRIHVEQGKEVEKGQILLEFDREQQLQELSIAEVELEAARRAALESLSSARSAYRSSVLVFQQSERRLKRDESLFNKGTIAEEQFRQAEEACRMAALEMDSARRQLNLLTGRSAEMEPVLDAGRDAQLVEATPSVRQACLSFSKAARTLEEYSLRAPFEGVVTQLMSAEGDSVELYDSLVTIQDLSEIFAEVQIDEVDIGKVDIGSKVEVSGESILGEVLEGTIRSVSPIVEKIGNSRKVTVMIDIRQGSSQPKVGGSCNAHIATTFKTDALAIPLSAYIAMGDRSYVYVLENSKEDRNAVKESNRQSDLAVVCVVRKREIRLGMTTITMAEVVDGLRDGERIATGNLSILREGMEVELDRP